MTLDDWRWGHVPENVSDNVVYITRLYFAYGFAAWELDHGRCSFEFPIRKIRKI